MSALIRPTRRGLLTSAAAAVALAGTGTAAYALGIEPVWRLDVTPYHLTPPGWPADLRLTAAVIADIHAGEPWMSPGRIAEIVAVANALQPDIVFLLGDYEPGHPFNTRPVPMAVLARELSGLKAPLGIHAILGNHDWWADLDLLRRRDGLPASARALLSQGINVLDNGVVRLAKDGRPFWVAGLGDQMALHALGILRGVDDLPGTLAKVTDDAPVILLAHEPYIARKIPKRVSLTLCGHTHGGQVRILGVAPLMRTRYVYGHVVDGDRHVIVSGGLGTSKFPIRFGSPPEVVLVKLGAAEPPAVS